MEPYAGLLKRAMAATLDWIVGLLLVLPLALQHRSLNLAVALVIPGSLLYPLYLISMHAHSGRSLGKMALGLRVLTISGGQISWRESLLRFSPLTVYRLLVGSIFLVTLRGVQAEAYESSGWMERGRLLAAAKPPTERVVVLAELLWLVLAAAVMVSNRRRRTIHDFIGGTVVVHESAIRPAPANRGTNEGTVPMATTADFRQLAVAHSRVQIEQPDRSVSLLVLGIIQIVLGVLVALLSLLVGILLAVRPPEESTSGRHYSPVLIAATLTLVYLIPAANLLITGIATVRFRPWARIATLASSWVWLFLGVLLLITMACLPLTNGSAPVGVAGKVILLLVMSLPFLGLPIALIVVYTRPGVKATLERRHSFKDAATLP